MIRMVVLDMAGTTVDEGNLVYKTLWQSINAWGFDFSMEEVLAKGAGKEKLQAIRDLIGINGSQADENLAREIHSDFIVDLTTAYRKASVKPQPHTEELFDLLKQKGIYVVLNTGYNTETAESLIDKLGWTERKTFDLLVTADDVESSRPNPDMIHHAMNHFALSEENQIIKVGDSIVDIQEGQNAGCLTIGITTGAHNEQQLRSANPDYIINDLIELMPIIDQHYPT